jgi:hypothetical protein
MENKKEINTTDKRERIGIETTLLGASSSMLGFCFVVISYLHATEKSAKTSVDELTMMSMLAFMTNCLLSFLAIRSSKFQTQTYVNLTSGIYLTGMLILFGIMVSIAFGMK